ncbi:hypothetical protein LPJ66_009617 [Kickxella alabastrina]|uniref:Uncharacterized protein n=1 Tax=Kickxella alabastrina TaxID=61397 RepID=A0ACC1I4Z2_9FUNG|nr:hypothetical protein LPJ66_009617 [Kickxella alabastrina]
MRKILKQNARAGSMVGVGRDASLAQAGVRRHNSVSREGSRRSSTSRPPTDILAHLQELKAQERQVLSRGTRDSLSATGSSAGANNPPLTAEEEKSRKERLARDERMALQYREQLKSRLQDINASAIDLGSQKATMARFERQMLGSSSPREMEQLELERINGVRSLIGLPALAPPPTLGNAGGGGGVRQSRPGTPMYVGSSPSNIPSPYHYPSAPSHASAGKPSARPHRYQHDRSSSFGEHQGTGAFGGHNSRPQVASSHHGPSAYTPGRDGRANQRQEFASGRADSSRGMRHMANDADEDDDEVQDMDLGMEDGELSEEGELAE